MRVSTSMYHKAIYEQSNNLLSNKLFDVNKQIASGLKIQYAHEDVITFSQTMRLDNEISTLAQAKKSTQSGYKFSNQSDVVLNEFNKSLDDVRTLLLKASNDTNSATSLDAIAGELRVVENNLKNLANTSMNGQYIFSGSSVDVKPISADGKYNGNNKALDAFTGARTQQQYNITGATLFLGEEETVQRTITTNVTTINYSKKYDYGTNEDNGTTPTPIKVEDTIRDLMGDTDDNIDTATEKHHFYIRGTNSSGDSFKKHIKMRDDETIESLLTQIGNEFGNTPDVKVVNVSLDEGGHITIEDKLNGSSKLDFHMVGAIDYVDGGTATDAGDVTDIDDLDKGDNNFFKILKGTSTAANDHLYIREFVDSGLEPAAGAATNIDGIVHDRAQFDVNGAKVSSNVPQIVNSSNAFAEPSTKLLDVSTSGSLDNKTIKLTGIDVNGATLDVDIKLLNTGSTFTIGGDTYDIFTASTPRGAVDADKMTYQQLMDVMNMVSTGKLPATAPGTAAEYDAAVADANGDARTHLSYDGKIQFEEIGKTSTQARIALYDSNSDDFGKPPSVMTFNSNNSLTIRDPKTDFFKGLDGMIQSIEDHKNWPDSTDGNKRSIGIENSISLLDDMQDHISRSHARSGSQSNALTISTKRIDLLKLSTATLRSAVIDTDLAEAALTLSNLNTNYSAMLASVGKISKLSLVNYL
jgi:flagellar hook-associated protein 3 FlgL